MYLSQIGNDSVWFYFWIFTFVKASSLFWMGTLSFLKIMEVCYSSGKRSQTVLRVRRVFLETTEAEPRWNWFLLDLFPGDRDKELRVGKVRWGFHNCFCQPVLFRKSVSVLISEQPYFDSLVHGLKTRAICSFLLFSWYCLF